MVCPFWPDTMIKIALLFYMAHLRKYSGIDWVATELVAARQYREVFNREQARLFGRLFIVDCILPL